MGPPGGGRNTVTLRFMRHFNIISMNPFNDESMTKIFTTLISTYLRVSVRDGSVGSKWVRLAPNGTNPGLFMISFQYIFASHKVRLRATSEIFSDRIDFLVISQFYKY